VPQPASYVTARMISDFCRQRLATVLAPREVERLRTYMRDVLAQGRRDAWKGKTVDWPAVAVFADIEEPRLRLASKIIQFGFDALKRALRDRPEAPAPRALPDPVPAGAATSGDTASIEQDIAPPTVEIPA
jgi:hypothetical protein